MAKNILEDIIAHQIVNQVESMMFSVVECTKRSDILTELAATEAGVALLNVEALIELQHSWLDMLEKLIKTFEKPEDSMEPPIAVLRDAAAARLEEMRADLPARGNDAL